MNKKVRRQLSKSLSIFLALLMAFCAIPMSAFAQTDAEVISEAAVTDTVISDDTSTGKTGTAITDEEPYVLGEVDSLRTETAKHFRMSDGSYVAVEYGKTVHFQDDTGDWQDFDNTLSLTESSDAKSNNVLESESTEIGYVSNDNDVNFEFAKTTDFAELVKIKDNDFTISLGLINAKGSKEIKVENTEEKTASEKPTIEEASVLPKYSSSVTYADILENIDIEYIAYGDNLKENIIVKSKSENYVYAFELDTDGLVAKLEENSSISLIDEKTGEVEYTIPAGYMFDAKGAYSDAMKYSLEQNENKTYTLSVTVDASWINADDRVFPVTVDPSIVKSGSCIYDTYVTNASTTSNYASSLDLKAGYISGYEYITLLSFYDLPEIPKSSIVTSSKIGYLVKTYPSSTINIGAYAITSSWNPTTVTWNTKPTIDTTVIDYDNQETSGVQAVFDITSLAKDWYSGSSSTRTYANGLALRSMSTTSSVNYYSIENGKAYPLFLVQYRDTKGLESRWTYTSHNAGNAGTGSVNDFSGNLVFTHDDMSTNGTILPVTVSHVFNTYLAGKEFTSTTGTTDDINTASYTNMRVGKGWKLSVQETIVPITIGGSDWLIYNDSDGTEIYFDDYIADGVFMDEDGYGLIITINSGSTTEYYKMTDFYGNIKTFSSSGCITYIRDVIGNEKAFVYITSNQLSTIQYKPAGSSTYITQLSFAYNSYNALYRVTNSQSGDYVEFYYSSLYNSSYLTTNTGYLRKIQYSNGEYATYNYLADGVLSYVTDGDTGSMVSYGYSVGNGAITNTSYKVAYVYERTSAYVYGQQAGFIYDKMKTSIRSTGNNDTYGDSDDILTSYVFDNKGRTICAYSSSLDGKTIYGTSTADYNDAEDGSKVNNTISKDSIAGTPSMNLIRNSGAESSSYWTTSTASSSQSTAVTSAYKHSGSYSYMVSSSNTTGYAKFKQDAYITEAGVYTLSAYVKTNNVTGTTGGAYLILEGSQSIKIIGTTNTNIQNGWQRISVTKEITENDISNKFGDPFSVELIINGASGTAYFDNIQLEKGKAPSTFNGVLNNNFDLPQDWSVFGGAYVDDPATTTTTSYDHGNVMSLTGSTSGSRYAAQTIALNAPLDTTFVLSGWGMANSASLSQDTARLFELTARFNYSNSTYETHSVPFNSDYNGWQFASGAIVPETTTTGITITSITVYCKYDYNVNTAYFDNISLTVEAAQTYTYDNDGNLISLKDVEGNKINTTYEDNGVDIASYTNIAGEKYLTNNYYYIGTVNTHLPDTMEKQSMANYSKVITTNYDYDSYGKLTSSTVTSNGSTESIKNGTCYNNYGNYISSSTDTNNQITYTNTNIVTDLLEYVEDANVNRTAFIYDNRERVSTFYHDVDCDGFLDSDEESISYTYSQNRLSTIITDGTTYNKSYNTYGETSSIGISGMSTSLASYIYNSNNGKLSRTTYGNGFYVENIYDELNRVITVKYNGVIKFSFTYNTSGQLFGCVDSVNNKIYNYEYDSLGRVIRAIERTASGSLVMAIEDQFDSLGRKTAATYIFTDRSLLYSISYNSNSNLISSYGLPSSNSISYNYDAFERLSIKDLSNVFAITYGYYSYTDNNGVERTSKRVVSLTLNPDGSATDIVYSYTYNNVGNISSISENGTEVQSFSYDALGQLLQEDNLYANQTYTYTYDKTGNITSKSSCEYKDLSMGNSWTQYNHDNTSWGDLLTSIQVNGVTTTTINYDAIGNPTNWKNLSSMQWQGRELSNISIDGINYGISYTYNTKNYRTGKTTRLESGTTSFTYVIDESNIIKETRTGSQTATIYYYYDDSGIIGFNYNNTNYFYGKNLQGDITKIFTSAGVEVVSYTYDTWGNPISTTGTLASTVGAVNPFRYRSYYYDTETGWYYLNSRYYDPSIGRFINSDGIIGANKGIVGNNMFAYCNNNPVMNNDPTGYCIVGYMYVPASPNTDTSRFEVGSECPGCGVILTNQMLVDLCEEVPSMLESPWMSAKYVESKKALGEAVCEGHQQCFVVGTLVLTEKGNVPIETIKTGDMVWSENPETGEKELKRVVRTFINEKDTLVHVFVDGQEIKTTEGHRFWVVGIGWVNSENLKNGDVLKLENGNTVIVEKIEFEKLDQPVKVYNFEVEDFHTYYVTDSAILVHNDCTPKYCNEDSNSLYSWTYTNYDQFGSRTEVHFTHSHGGSSMTHIHCWLYNSQGFQGRTTWDINGVMY